MKANYFPSRVLSTSWLAVGWAVVWLQAAPAEAVEDEAVAKAMQEALYAEEVKGDPATALKAYEAVVARFEEQRDLAATALFRQGECLRKLDRPQEAAAVYRRLLTLFPDKERLARLSRENLVALGQSVPEALGAPEAPAISTDEQKELARVRAMAANSPDLLFSTGGNAFRDAAANGHLTVLEWFLTDQSTGIAPHLADAAQAAVEAGQLKACERLLAAGAPTSGLLSVAVQNQRWSVLRLLLAAKADVAEVSEVPAHSALVSPPGSQNAKVNGPILLLALGGRQGVPLDVLKDLLTAGANPNEIGKVVGVQGWTMSFTPLAMAVRTGQSVEVLRLLLEAKAAPNVLVGESGQTALMIALERAPEDQVDAVVEALVAGGVDWTTRGGGGSTALHTAAAFGRARWVEAATQAGVDPNAATEDAETPLIAAQGAPVGYRSVPALLKAGAKIQSVHPKHGNPLAQACKTWPRNEESLQALDSLLQAGANPIAPGMVNSSPVRPLEAVLDGWMAAWPAAIEVLLRHGARPDGIPGLFTQVGEVVAQFPKIDGLSNDTMKPILAAFRPLWKTAHGRDNRRLKEAIWLDEGEAKLQELAQFGGTGAPVFVALFSEESALDGVPALRDVLRQRLFWVGAGARQWDQATITRQVDGQESLIPLNIVAVAQGKSPEPTLHWGDVVSIPASAQSDLPVEGLVRGWCSADKNLTIRIDLGHGGVVSNRPAGAAPMWDAQTMMAPDLALETVVRRAGIPREILNLGVSIKRVGSDCAMALLPSTETQTVRHGDIVAITPPELKPSLSEEALRAGVWLCKSKDGPFWPVNPMPDSTFGPPLGYLLLALQAPHPTVFPQVDWEKAVLRTWVPPSDGTVAAGQERAEATWKEEPLLASWSTARLRQGQVLILPSAEGEAREMPAELKDGLAKLGFAWSLQIGTAAGLPMTYQPRFFARQLLGGRVVWSDVESDDSTGPVLPLSLDLVGMSKPLTEDVSSGVDPLQGGSITADVWARPDFIIRYDKNQVPNEAPFRRRVRLPTPNGVQPPPQLQPQLQPQLPPQLPPPPR